MTEYLICVATINNPSRLEAFIKTVLDNTDSSKTSFRISVVDDSTVQEYRNENHSIAVKYDCFYARNSQRMGVPYSWNKAVSLWDSKYVVVANDDIVLCPLWLEAHAAFVKANSKKKLGVLGWPATNTLSEISTATTFEVGPQIEHLTTRRIVSPSGSLFAFSRDLYNKVGGFDDMYFATFEEVDFGAKTSLLGLKNFDLSAPTIYHQGGASFNDPLNRDEDVLSHISLSRTLWIQKWSEELKIERDGRSDEAMVELLSDELVSRQPNYKAKDLKKVTVSK